MKKNNWTRKARKQNEMLVATLEAGEADPLAFFQEYTPPPYTMGAGVFLSTPDAARQLVRAADLQPGDWVLDLGAGLGVISYHLRQAGVPVGRIEAVEFIDELYQIGSQLTPDVTWVWANAFEDSFWKPRMGKYDLVISYPPWGQTDNRQSVEDISLLLGANGKVGPAYAEMMSLEVALRLLRPGGRAVFLLPSGAFELSSWKRYEREMAAYEDINARSVKPFDVDAKIDMVLAVIERSDTPFPGQTFGSNGKDDRVATAQVIEEAVPPEDDLLAQALTDDLFASPEPPPRVEAGTTAEEEVEADPTGFVPGEGDAYDYIPLWMNVPRFYQTEKQDDPLAVVKLFTPDSQWTWYVIEYDPQEKTAFGLVVGFETELGYFSIDEIVSVKGPLGLRIERDIWFRLTPVTQLPEYQAKWGERGPYKGTAKPETLTCEEAQAILDRELEPEQNPNQTLTVGMLDAMGRVMEAEIVESEVRDEDYVPLPEGWTVEDIAYLLEKLEEGPILVADSELGIPTIHDVVDAKLLEHCGLGLMEARGTGFTLHFDAGGAMHHTPSGKSWSALSIEGEGYSYDFGGVQATLEGYLYSAGVGSDGGKAPISSGSLRIVYLGDAPDSIVWTGDTRSFQRYSEGSEGLRQAFDFLNAVKEHVEAAEECRVVAIQKDFGSGVHARVEPAKTGSECLQIEGWEGFNLSLTPSSNLADELGYLMRNCYAEPGVPDDWSAPGLHLAQYVRTLIRRAHTALRERDGKVFWTELWAEFGELSRADGLLGRVEQVGLWSRERFLEGMDDIQVVKRQSWTYREPDERRLAKKYQGDRDNLMAALAKAKNETRRNDVLSELADLDALPDEYVPAERAGRPDEQANELSDGAGCKASEDTRTAPANNVVPAPDADVEKTKPAAKKAKLPDDIPEAIEVDLGHTHGWATAQVLRVNGKWLFYRLDDEAKVDKRRGKVQVYGRGIVWRVPEGEITDVSNN